ncbi:MAG: hypothetical protein EAX95_07840 [Candidatus Thorarchaeota archaeon]|nr:hypothetical protein [Candidatus Thorarchaeota archaeon]
MEKLTAALDRYATVRNLALAILASIVVIAIMGYATETFVYSVYGEATMPDTRFWYTYGEILSAFSALGPDGLQLWSQIHLLDLLFPLAYSFSLVFGTLMELRKAVPERPSLRKLSLLPLLAAVADYLENTIVASQIAVYPNLSEPVVALASFVTATKWLLLGISFALVLALLVVLAYQRFTKK